MSDEGVLQSRLNVTSSCWTTSTYLSSCGPSSRHEETCFCAMFQYSFTIFMYHNFGRELGVLSIHRNGICLTKNAWTVNTIQTYTLNI